MTDQSTNPLTAMMAEMIAGIPRSSPLTMEERSRWTERDQAFRRWVLSVPCPLCDVQSGSCRGSRGGDISPHSWRVVAAVAEMVAEERAEARFEGYRAAIDQAKAAWGES